MKLKGVLLVNVAICLFCLGCASGPKPKASALPDPKKVTFSEPAPQGKYGLPYKADGTLAGWVERAREARKKYETAEKGRSAQKGVAKHLIGGLAGKLAEKGADEAAKAAKKKILDETVGEIDTDQFFDDECQYAYYLFGKYSENQDYQDILNLVFFVYDPIEQKYQACLEKYLKEHPESAPEKKQS